jgi:hypothetical protein
MDAGHSDQFGRHHGRCIVSPPDIQLFSSLVVRVRSGTAASTIPNGPVGDLVVLIAGMFAFSPNMSCLVWPVVGDSVPEHIHRTPIPTSVNAIDYARHRPP